MKYVDACVGFISIFDMVGFSMTRKSIEDMNKWYKKCIELCWKSNGQPGLRPLYGPQYYGAFIVDPDGYLIETCISTFTSLRSSYKINAIVF